MSDKHVITLDHEEYDDGEDVEWWPECSCGWTPGKVWGSFGEAQAAGDQHVLEMGTKP